MVHQLTFQTTHLSISSFPTIELPDFAMITGKNGSGKSHLLQALYNGSIRSTCAPNQAAGNQTEIRIFDWSTLVPQDTGSFSSETFRNERQYFFQLINGIKQNPHYLEPIRAVARSYGLNNIYLDDIAGLISLDVEDLRKHFPEEGRAEIIHTNLKNAITQSENTVYSNLDPNNALQLRSLAAITKKTIFSLNDKDIFSNSIPSWGGSSIFQQSFSRLFVAYRDVFLENELANLQSQRGEDSDFLDSNQFEKKFGPAPWTFVNAALANAGLDFEINHPHLYSYSPYEPRLTKKKTGAQLAFSNLSSGEKVLMSFAFCIYYSQDRRQISTYPKLLLLDEIDAPLHPSMSHGLIETIKNTLVRDFEIKVIATTHSPSTVAMSDESSIYVMRGNGLGLSKTSKATSLNVLTDGVPTISIDYRGRKQVFVESPSDAQTYSDLYRAVKSKIISECSLEFISTGTRSSSGNEENTGCEAVKRLVNDLTTSGNTTVFGLLDWDKKHSPSSRIAVIAYGSRDGLENVLLDPLLVCGLICRDFKEYKPIIGVDESTSYIDFLMLPYDKYQILIDRFCKHVFSSPPDESVESEYCGNFTLRVDKRCLFTDDHTYEHKIYNAFPHLLSIARQKKPGLLMQHIINTVVLDKVDFIPKDALSVLQEILDKPNHFEQIADSTANMAT